MPDTAPQHTHHGTHALLLLHSPLTTCVSFTLPLFLQCVVQLERQAEQLVELLQALRQSQSGSSSGGGAAETTGGTALAAQRAAQQAQHAGVPLGAIPFHLHKLVKRLVTRSSPVSSGKGATTHAASRQQRHAARIVSAFTVISGKELHAQQAQQVQQPHQGRNQQKAKKRKLSKKARRRQRQLAQPD